MIWKPDRIRSRSLPASLGFNSTTAVAELARLVRPGGHLLLEFYNPMSLRYLAKRVGGPWKIAADGTTEKDVYTRFDTLSRARRYLPAGVDLVAVRGVRVLTPSSEKMRLTCDFTVSREISRV